MKTIETLVDDILEVLENGVTEEEINKHLEDMEDNLEKQIRRQLIKKEEGNNDLLRMSNIGNPCDRKLWYAVNEADNPKREKITGDTRFKFMYGDLTEELLLLFAALAGHKVEGQQDEMEIAGIKGHRDAVIDGWVVDVKSASTYSFKKFKEGRLRDDDPFGYYAQLMSYLYAAKDDPLVTEKSKAAFLVFDKQLGHICLDIHEKPDWFDELPEGYERRKAMVAGDLPDRSFEPVEDGYTNKQKEFVPNGNLKLDTFCSYCDFKHVCYDNIRTFLYAGGKPVYLTKVVKEPKVYEVKDKE